MSNKNEAFVGACRRGKLGMAKTIYYAEIHESIHSLNDVIDFEMALMKACEYGHLNIMQWIDSLDEIDIYNEAHYICRCACKRGYFDMIQWVHSMVDVDDLDHATYFDIACKHGHLNIARWLHSLGQINFEHKNPIFRLVCKRGHLDVAQWLHSQNPIDARKLEYSFQLVCEFGYLDIAQWIYSLIDTDISFDLNYAFCIACENDNLDIAKWIYSLDHACRHGYLNVVRWLYSLDEIGTCTLNGSFVFIKKNDLNMLQFFLECSLDLNVKDCAPLKCFVTWKNKLEVHQLLLEYCKEEHYCYLDEKIVKLLLTRTKSARKIEK